MLKEQDQQHNWTNTRMRALLADDYCPKCEKHRTMHDDTVCDMRYTTEETDEQL